MSSAYVLRLIADPSSLETVRAFVEQKALSLGVTPDALYDVLVAVHEMVANVVEHGYGGQPGVIEVELRGEGDALVVRLIDEAAPFDPTAVPAPDITIPPHKRPAGGMGILMTRRYVDSMTHRVHARGGNELVLVKRGVVTSSP
jgi:anti-sigma regulatory factor (Ser/Thr protein kinase)